MDDLERVTAIVDGDLAETERRADALAWYGPDWYEREHERGCSWREIGDGALAHLNEQRAEYRSTRIAAYAGDAEAQGLLHRNGINSTYLMAVDWYAGWQRYQRSARGRAAIAADKEARP